jgi:hypothetical protein
MESSVTLVIPWRDPVNTFRASKVDEMVDMILIPDGLDYKYSVGITPGEGSFHTLKIRNKSVNTVMHVSLTLPSFIECQSGLEFDIAPLQTISPVLLLVEGDAVQKSQQVQKLFTDSISLVVTPMTVKGPVYVSKALLPLA